MCNVKKGKDVERYEDLQNLVTSVFLQQHEPFKLNDIKRIVKAQLNGATNYYELSRLEDDTENICENTFKILRLSSCLQYRNGKYSLAISFPMLRPLTAHKG